MKRKLILAALTLAAWQLSAATASACSCLEYGTPPCAAYARADAVFAGVVTDIRKLPAESGQAPPEALVRFTVEESFKGVSVRELEVATLHDTSCDIGFKKGERWLVYAHRGEGAGQLGAPPCTRTHRLGGADADLDYLRGLWRGGAEQSVNGRLALGGYEPLAGVKVSVSGGGETFGAETEADGSFSVRLPRGGAYTVRAVVPFSAEAGSRIKPVRADPTDERTVVEYAVEVPSGQCAYDEVRIYKIDLHATAELSGKVVDEAGQPVTRGYVRLFRAEPEEGSNPEAAHTRINEDGGFKFEGVAVGNYHLVLNPRDEAPDEYDAPHPKTFYPGVADQSQATPIVVTEGLKLGDLVLRARPALRERVLTGVVVWPDGKPAAGANVSLYDAAGKGRYVRAVKADIYGQFEVSLYGDFKYEVSASVYGERAGESGKVKVPEADERPRVKIVLKRQ